MSKKDFKNLNTGELLNPAMQFITPQAQAEATPEPKKEEKKTPKKKKADSKETKTKHLHLLFKPSVVEDITKIAFMQKTSLNSLISDILEGYIKDHAEQIRTYNKVFEK